MKPKFPPIGAGALLLDKVALVTGSSSGIGFAVAERFLHEGAKVMITGRSRARCRSALKQLKQVREGRVDFVSGDVSNAEDAKSMVTKTVERFGRIDILVNNAGIYLEKRAEDTTEDEWDSIVDINLKGVFLASKAAYAYFKKQHRGVIINISSVAGLYGDLNCAAYCAAKGGISNLTRAMALDYAKENIRVNAVCPAAIDTPMLDEEARRHKDRRKYLRVSAEAQPIGRVGTAEEVAFTVLMLTSNEASFITGVNMPVDGGLTAR
jgi:meso-butanediol dehydrogenase/(S,S)-butanediol dehydrogenase/diacetyl reductase